MSGARGRKFLSHAGVYGVGALLLQCTSFVLLPLYTHYLTPAEYGVLQFLYRIGEAFNIVLMANGLRAATMNFWGQSESDADRMSVPASLAALSGVVLLVGGLAAWALSPTLSRFLELNDSALLGVGVFATLLKILTVMPLALMQARFESRRFVATTAVLAAVQIVFTAAGVVILGWGVWGIVIALAATHGILGVALTLRELRAATFRPRLDQLQSMLRFALPLIPTGVCFFVIHSGDQFFLAHYSGAAVLGLYAFAYRLVQGVELVSTYPLTQVWSAAMYDAYRQSDRSAHFGVVLTRVLAAYTLGGVALILFQGELIGLLASESFRVTGGVVALLVFAKFFLTAANHLDSAFYVTRRTDLKPWIAFVSVAVVLACYAILIPRYHALGAAGATVLGYACTAVATGLMAQRVFSIDLEWRRLGLLLVFLSLAVGVEAGVSGHVSLPTSLGLRLAFLVVFPLAAWRFGGVSEEEKRFASYLFHEAVSLAIRGRISAGIRTR